MENTESEVGLSTVVYETAEGDRAVVREIAQRLKQLAAKYGLTFGSSMIAGFLAHAFILTNKLINSDDIRFLFGKGSTVSSGRWGLELMSVISPDFSMPWLYGLITILLFSIGACMVVSLFNIKSPICQILWGGVFISFPSLTGTLCYTFTATSYAVTFLLAVGGVWLVTRRRIVDDLLACLLFVLSLGIYQAYLGFICCFFVILLLQEVMDPEQKTGRILKDAGHMLIVLVASGIAYLAVTWVILQLTHTPFNDYAAANMTAETSIPMRIVWAYFDFFRQMNGLFGIVPSTLLFIMTLICILGAAIALLTGMIKKQPLSRILMALLLIALFPLGVDCLYVLLCPGCSHALTQYDFVAGYLLVLTLIDRMALSRPRLQNILRITTYTALAVIIAGNIFTANKTYLNLTLRNEQMEAFYTRIVTQIELQPEFDSDKTVALIGQPALPDDWMSEFGRTNQIAGVKKTAPGTYSQIEYLNRWIGFNVPFASDEEIEAIKALPEFEAMPCYPYYGSVAAVGDYIIVKFSGD